MRLAPMLAEPAAHPPAGEGWRYEPKYDGMRALAFVGVQAVALVSRGAHDRTRQFPEVAEALRELRAGAGCDLVLDGELVAGDEHGYEGFRALQGRISLEDPFRIRLRARSRPCSLVCFDLLIHAGSVLVGAPLEERRARLEDILATHGGGRVRLAEQSTDLEGTIARAYAEGWEGIVAKQRASLYRSGERSPAWRKWKPSLRQEFVVVGWTESERREHLGALLLGYYEGGALRYAGRVGSGFGRRALADVAEAIRPFERSICPLDRLPDLAEAPRWLEPRIVAEVRFDAWSTEGRLRFPRFVGLRSDRDPREVRREEPLRAASA
jgi:bifunctional non-homologous end joining protein LigD